MIYQFKCANTKCLEEFEVEQHITDRHQANCPGCGRPAQRMYTPTAFRFGKADYNKDGSRDLNPDLPHVPRGTSHTRGWTKKEEK